MLSWDAGMPGKSFSKFLVKMLPDLPFLGPISLLEELCDPPLKSNDIISLCFPDRFSFFQWIRGIKPLTTMSPKWKWASWMLLIYSCPLVWIKNSHLKMRNAPLCDLLTHLSRTLGQAHVCYLGNHLACSCQGSSPGSQFLSPPSQ